MVRWSLGGFGVVWRPASGQLFGWFAGGCGWFRYDLRAWGWSGGILWETCGSYEESFQDVFDVKSFRKTWGCGVAVWLEKAADGGCLVRTRNSHNSPARRGLLIPIGVFVGPGGFGVGGVLLGRC